MPSEGRQKKIMEKLNRAQKCSILGPQNLGSGGPPGSAPDNVQGRNHEDGFTWGKRAGPDLQTQDERLN